MTPKPFLTTLAILFISFFLLSFHDSRFRFRICSSSPVKGNHVIIIPIEGAVGPESLAFDPHGGGPYTGVSDGRIIRWMEEHQRWADFAVTSPQRDRCGGGSHDHAKGEDVCGRPLGLHFNEKTGQLYVADAYMGLLVVDNEGGQATRVATQAQLTPFGFTNGLDIDQTTGVVYFSDSSSLHPRRNHIKVILSGDVTGRLMKYDPRSNQTTVLLSNVTYPNGVALSKDRNFLLFSETTNCRIMRLWLETPKAGIVEIFTQLPGFPDNIKRNIQGEFWVAIPCRKGMLLKWLISSPRIGRLLTYLPLDITKIHTYFANWMGRGLAVKVSGNGDVLKIVEDKMGNGWKFLSEVLERDGKLWVGSLGMPFISIQEEEE